MKQKTWLIPVLASVTLMMGCGKLDFKRTKTGLLYKIIATKNTQGPLAKAGNVLKLYFQQKLNDSVMQTNVGKMPVYATIQAVPMGTDYTPSEVFPLLHKGDSVVTVMLVDSLVLKGKMPTIPQFMKRGDRIITSFKIVDLFSTDSVARLDNQKEMAVDREKQNKEMAVLGDKEKKEIEDYLSANKITTQKTPGGAFVEIISQGTGPQADSGKLVSLKYRGTTFDGKTFDTNVDSSFHHTQPFKFLVGTGGVIPGLDEGIRMLKKGAKANIYVPSVLGYGPNPVMQGGKPYENLIFDIDVLDVTDKPAPKLPLQKADTTQRKK